MIELNNFSDEELDHQLFEEYLNGKADELGVTVLRELYKIHGIKHHIIKILTSNKFDVDIVNRLINKISKEEVINDE